MLKTNNNYQFILQFISSYNHLKTIQHLPQRNSIPGVSNKDLAWSMDPSQEHLCQCIPESYQVVKGVSSYDFQGYLIIDLLASLESPISVKDMIDHFLHTLDKGNIAVIGGVNARNTLITFDGLLRTFSFKNFSLLLLRDRLLLPWQPLMLRLGPSTMTNLGMGSFVHSELNALAIAKHFLVAVIGSISKVVFFSVSNLQATTSWCPPP